MNILHINTTDTSGSAIAAKRLSAGLIKSGIESQLLVLDKSGRGDANVLCFFGADSSKLSKINNLIRRHLLPSWYGYKMKIENPNENTFTFPKTLIDITTHPAYSSADIIHFHNVADFVSISSFFEKNTKPLVWTLHDFNPFTGGNHLPIELNEQNSQYKNLWTKNYKIKFNAYRKAKNFAIAAPSRWIMKEAEISGMFDGLEIRHIPNGVDTQQFKPYPKDFAKSIFQIPENGKKNILFIADDHRLKNKGKADFLIIYEALKYNYNFIVVGNGSNDKTFNRDGIIQLGYINSDYLLPIIYNIADICIVLSQVESFSLITLESLACGIPVIAYSSGGPDELIIHSKNGFIIEKNNTTEFISAIHKSLIDDLLYQGMKSSAVESAQNYDIKKISAKYIELYNSVL